MLFTFEEKQKALTDIGYTITEEKQSDETYYIVSDDDGKITFDFRNKPGTAQVNEMFETFYKQTVLTRIVSDNLKSEK